jgi:cholinephosphate cytidylyltransferase/choline kinase
VVGCKKEYFFHLAEQFGATIGGRDAWIMLGHAYFDRAFSAAFTRIPEEVYDLPRTAPLLRESIYLDHVKELDMVIWRYPAGVINEFDSVDEIRGFDPMLMENVDSKVIGIISSALGCAKSQIHDFYPLKQGITNPFCHFAVDDREYVYRHPGIGTDKIIDRRAETASLELVGEWLFIYYRHAADHVDRLLAEYESAARATAKGARA